MKQLPEYFGTWKEIYQEFKKRDGLNNFRIERESDYGFAFHIGPKNYEIRCAFYNGSLTCETYKILPAGSLEYKTPEVSGREKLPSMVLIISEYGVDMANGRLIPVDRVVESYFEMLNAIPI